MLDPHETLEPALASLARRLAELHPEQAPFAPLGVLGSGFFSIALETPSGLVLRLSRTEQAAARHRVEHAALSAIGAQINLAIPQPLFAIPRGPGAPFGGYAHRKLSGRTMTQSEASGHGWGSVAEALGRLVAQLHALPPGSVPAIPTRSVGVTVRGAGVGGLRELRERVAVTLRPRLTVGEWRRLDRWWEMLASATDLVTPGPVIRHNDLWWENLLLDTEGNLSGILDWEWLSAGDPAGDFAPMLHMGERFVDRALDAYRASGGTIDSEFRFRLARLWELRELEGIGFALELRNEEELQDGISKLRQGAILA